MHKNYSLDQIPSIAQEVIASAKHKMLLFYGDMGIGKTTLIKEICKQLGIKDVAHSPTFSLVNEYQTTKGDAVFHFDFYRITDENEAYDIGIEDYFYANNWCLIEWPENIENLLPLESVKIHLTLLEDGLRNIQLKTNL